MCFNKEVSLITFAVLICSSIFIIKRNYKNDRWFSVIFILAGLMQLVEYFMWIDQKCGTINHWATLIAYIILLLQPVGIITGGYYLGSFNIDKKYLFPIMIFYWILYGIGIIYAIIKSFKIKLCSLARYPHLEWDIHSLYFSKIFYRILFIFYHISVIILFLSKPTIYGIILGCLYLFSLFFSLILIDNPSWKSFWCWLVNFIPIIYIGATYILKKKLKYNNNQE